MTEAATPDRLGRYRILRRLGRGGMATVYHAVQEGPHGFENEVAIKLVHPHLLQSHPHVVQMLVDEARIAAKIRHANVVRILDLVEEEDCFYLVMDYVDGVSLRQVLDAARQSNRAPNPGPIIEVLGAACVGLHAAHDLKRPDGSPMELVHRDVKPGNILVSAGGEVKVADFGIAYYDDRISENTAHGQLKGTPAYMSPEQVLGEKLDVRSDIFSMGLTLYTLLTNRLVFSAESPMGIAVKIASESLEPHARELEALLDGLGLVFAKATAKDPDERYQDALELSEALRDVHRAIPHPGSMTELLAAAGWRPDAGAKAAAGASTSPASSAATAAAQATAGTPATGMALPGALAQAAVADMGGAAAASDTAGTAGTAGVPSPGDSPALDRGHSGSPTTKRMAPDQTAATAAAVAAASAAATAAASDPAGSTPASPLDAEVTPVAPMARPPRASDLVATVVEPGPIGSAAASSPGAADSLHAAPPPGPVVELIIPGEGGGADSSAPEVIVNPGSPGARSTSPPPTGAPASQFVPPSGAARPATPPGYAPRPAPRPAPRRGYEPAAARKHQPQPQQPGAWQPPGGLPLPPNIGQHSAVGRAAPVAAAAPRVQPERDYRGRVVRKAGPPANTTISTAEKVGIGVAFALLLVAVLAIVMVMKERDPTRDPRVVEAQETDGQPAAASAPRATQTRAAAPAPVVQPAAAMAGAAGGTGPNEPAESEAASAAPEGDALADGLPLGEPAAAAPGAKPAAANESVEAAAAKAAAAMKAAMAGAAIQPPAQANVPGADGQVAAAKEPVRKAVAGPKGRLTVNSYPYSTVLVDGKEKGRTPIVELEVPVGAHTVKLIFPTLGNHSELQSVRVEEGKEVRLVKRLNEDDFALPEPEPEPAEPAAAEPAAAEPAPAEPAPAEPAPAEPPASEPAAAEPEPAEPSAAEPEPAEPAAAEPAPADEPEDAPAP